MTTPQRFNIEANIPDFIKKIDLQYGYPDVFPYRPHKVDEDRLTETTLTRGYVDTSISGNEHDTFRGEMSRDIVRLLTKEIDEHIKRKIWEAKEQERDTIPLKKKERSGYPALKPENPDEWMKKLAENGTFDYLSNRPPHGFREKSLLTKLATLSVPFERALWFSKIVLYDMKKDDKDLKKLWTSWIISWLAFDQLKSSQEDPLRTYVIKLLYWSYMDGLIDHVMLFRSLTTALQMHTEKTIQRLIASILFQYVGEIGQFPSIAEDLLSKCEKIAWNVKNQQHPESIKLYSVICGLMKVIVSYCPYMIATLDKPGPILELLESPSFQEGLKGTQNVVFPHIEVTQGNRWLLSLEAENQSNVHSIHKMIQYQASLKQPSISQSWILDAIDHLDACMQKFDLNALYQALFTNANARNPSKSILLLCEWAITPHRYGLSRMYLASSILQLRITRATKEEQVTVQDTLVLFLDVIANLEDGDVQSKRCLLTSFLHFHTNIKKLLLLVSRFYGELIRLNVFKFEEYVKNLIARGIFSRPSRKADGHKTFLLQIPIVDPVHTRQKTLAYQLGMIGDVNQLNQVHLYPQILNNLEEAIKNEDPNVLETYLTNLIKDIYTNELISKGVALTQFFIKNLKDNIHRYAPQERVLYIWSLMTLLESIHDYRSLIQLLMWLLDHAKDQEIENLVVFTIHKVVVFIFCTDNILTILDTVQKNIEKTKSRRLESLLQYILKFYERNPHVVEWKSRLKNQLNPVKKKIKLNLTSSEKHSGIEDMKVLALAFIESMDEASATPTSIHEVSSKMSNYIAKNKGLSLVGCFMSPIYETWIQRLEAKTITYAHVSKSMTRMISMIRGVQWNISHISTWEKTFLTPLKSFFAHSIKIYEYENHPHVLILLLSHILCSGIASMDDVIMSLSDLFDTIHPENETLWKSETIEVAIDVIRLLIFEKDLLMSRYIKKYFLCFPNLYCNFIHVGRFKSILKFLYNVHKNEKLMSNVSTKLEKINFSETYIYESIRMNPLEFYNVLVSLDTTLTLDAWKILNLRVLGRMGPTPKPSDFMDVYFNHLMKDILSSKTNEWSIKESWIEIKLLLDVCMESDKKSGNKLPDAKEALSTVKEPSIPHTLAAVIIKEITKSADVNILLKLVTLMDRRVKREIGVFVLKALSDKRVCIGELSLYDFITTSTSIQSPVHMIEHDVSFTGTSEENACRSILKVHSICFEWVDMVDKVAFVELIFQYLDISRFSYSMEEWRNGRLKIDMYITILSHIIHWDQTKDDEALFSRLPLTLWISMVMKLYHFLCEPMIQSNLFDNKDIWFELLILIHSISKYNNVKWKGEFQKLILQLYTDAHMPPNLTFKVEQVLLRFDLHERKTKTFECNSSKAIVPEIATPYLEKYGKSPLFELFSYGESGQKTMRYAKRQLSNSGHLHESQNKRSK